MKKKKVVLIHGIKMNDKKFAIVFGTRPEILKFTPIIKELEKQQVKHKVYFTGQHFTKSMGKNFFKEFGIKISGEYEGKFVNGPVLKWVTQKFAEYEPDIVLVQGDTSSALIGAIAAAFSKIPVAHIEAGLRSFNFLEPFPEEYNRAMIDSMSTYLFCPTNENKNNVVTHRGSKSYVTGNTIIDLLQTAKRDTEKSNQVLITIHRRENWDRIKEICRAIDFLAENLEHYKFVWIKHDNKKLANSISQA